MQGLGQVDRLAVTATGADRRIQVGPIRAARIEDIRESYLGQLALYREVLQALYPNHACARRCLDGRADSHRTARRRADHALSRLGA
jgi:hypothetical protein